MNQSSKTFSSLLTQHGFKEPVVKQVSREGWVSFIRDDAEITIGYEPLSLPWGYLTNRKDGEADRRPLNELMKECDFRIDDYKYRAFDEISERLSNIESPEAADEFAKNVRPQLHKAVANFTEDLAAFLRRYLTRILTNS